MLYAGCHNPHHYPKLSNEFLQQKSYCPNMPIIDPGYFIPSIYDIEKGYFFDREKISGDLLYELCLNEKGEPFHVEQIWGQQIIGDYFKRRIFTSRYENGHNAARLPARTYIGIRIRDIDNDKYHFLSDNFYKNIKYQSHRYPLGTLATAIFSFEKMLQEKNFSDIASISHLPVRIKNSKKSINAKELESLIAEYTSSMDNPATHHYNHPIKHGNNYHLVMQSKNRSLTLIFSSSCLTGGYKITDILLN